MNEKSVTQIILKKLTCWASKCLYFDAGKGEDKLLTGKDVKPIYEQSFLAPTWTEGVPIKTFSCYVLDQP